MSVLITGGAGFLGQAVARRLLKDQQSVVLYDLSPLRDAELASKVTAVRGDVTDGLQLVRVAKEHQVDAIVHLAAILAVESDRDPGLAVRVSCGGMVNALEAARILAMRRVVWASSAAVFGGFLDGRLIANDSPFAPRNIYGATKILNESLAEQYTKGFGVDTVGFRFSLMTSAGKAGGVSGRLGDELIQKPVSGQPGRVPFGDDIASWLWVDDAAEAVVRATLNKANTPSRFFNIGGETRPIKDAVEIVRRLIPGAQLTLEPGTANLYHRMDVSALQKELGYTPHTSLDDQLRMMVERARRDQAGAKTA